MRFNQSESYLYRKNKPNLVIHCSSLNCNCPQFKTGPPSSPLVIAHSIPPTSVAPGVFPSAGTGVLLSAATVIRRAVNSNVSDMTRRAAHHVPTTNHKTIRSRQAGKKDYSNELT